MSDRPNINIELLALQDVLAIVSAPGAGYSPEQIAEVEDALIALLDAPAKPKFGNKKQAAGRASVSLCGKPSKSTPKSKSFSVRKKHTKPTPTATPTAPTPSATATEPDPTILSPTPKASLYRPVARKVLKTLDDVALTSRHLRAAVRSRKAMAPYEALKGAGRILGFHDALQRSGSVLAFTLHIRPDIAAKAVASGNPANYLMKRLRHHLTQAGLPCSLWFTIEIERSLTGGPDLFHIHGAALCEDGQRRAFKRCARLAGGQWDTNARYQCKTARDPDFGWVGYSSKDFYKAILTRLYGEEAGQNSLPFPSKPYIATRGIAAIAKSRYNEKRSNQLAKTKSGRPISDVEKSVNTDLSPEVIDEDSELAHDSVASDLGAGADTHASVGHHVRTALRPPAGSGGAPDGAARAMGSLLGTASRLRRRRRDPGLGRAHRAHVAASYQSPGARVARSTARRARPP